MRYTFWHGKPVCSTKDDTEWLNTSVTSLKRNQFSKPLYFDGSNWLDPQRQKAAMLLLGALSKNTSCPKLVLQNALLDVKTEAAFAQSMQDNKHLRSITLRQLTTTTPSNSSSTTSISVEESLPLSLPTGIFENPRLESLTVSGCRLDYQACLALANIIHPSPASGSCFTSLSLNQVDIAPEGLPCLFEAIAQSTTLQHLKFERMSWKLKSVATPSPEESDDNSDSDEKKDADDTSTAATTTREFLITAAALNESLVSLSLEHMNLNQEIANDLALVLKRNSQNLKHVSLRHNDLNGAAIKVLVQDGLVHNTHVERLYLSHNPLGDDGAQHLMHGLLQDGRKLSSLQELCLIETEIFKPGCMAILEGLRVLGHRSNSSSALSKLHLDRNNLEACGPDAIVRMLQDNMTLTSLLDTLPFLLRKLKGAAHSSEYEQWRQVDFLLRANKAQRRFFLQQQDETAAGDKVIVSPSLLVPRVLALPHGCSGGSTTPSAATRACSQPDVLYSLLSACLPQTLAARSPTTTTSTSGAHVDNPKEHMVLRQQQPQPQRLAAASTQHSPTSSSSPSRLGFAMPRRMRRPRAPSA